MAKALTSQEEKDQDEDKDVLVVVETPPEKDDEDEDKKPAPKVADDDHDDDDEDDKPPKTSEEEQQSAEDQDAIRARRAIEKKERKERKELAIERRRKEMEFLRRRNEDVERRLSAFEARATTQDINTYDQRIAQAAERARLADQVIAKAVAAGNGEDVARAMNLRDQARAEAQQVAFAKQQAMQYAQQRQQAPPPMDPVVESHAAEFLSENKWYDVNGGDRDSAAMLKIDQSMVAEGYDPKSAEYWTELRERAARRFPDKFKAQRQTQTQERTPRGGPQIGSGKEHAPASTRKEVYISPERKQAMIEANVWEDPVLRDRYVKAYTKYDRDAKEGNF